MGSTPLAELFGQLVREQPVFREVFGVISGDASDPSRNHRGGAWLSRLFALNHASSSLMVGSTIGPTGLVGDVVALTPPKISKACKRSFNKSSD